MVIIHKRIDVQLSLKNKHLHLVIDHPGENYCGSRFDWTGKIVDLKFQNIPILTREKPAAENEHLFGRGLYNEFGIDSALGFEETEMGGWFHKIGIGLIKKVSRSYDFNKTYEIKPALFSVLHEKDKLIICCTSESLNGYAYRLKKEIELLENRFSINYTLDNTGEKKILTREYNHNFIGINEDSIGKNMVLKFPFQMNSEGFEEVVNPGNKVKINTSELKFKETPKEPFFFSKLSGNKVVDAQWELHDLNSKIGIRETGNFQTQSINVWGSKHVISPELFIELQIPPGHSKKWSRTYEVFTL